MLRLLTLTARYREASTTTQRPHLPFPMPPNSDDFLPPMPVPCTDTEVKWNPQCKHRAPNPGPAPPCNKWEKLWNPECKDKPDSTTTPQPTTTAQHTTTPKPEPKPEPTPDPNQLREAPLPVPCNEIEAVSIFIISMFQLDE